MARLLSEKRIMVPPSGGVSYIRTQLYTGGTHTFTPGSDAKQLIIWLTGGGGGGGKGGQSYNHGGGGAGGATAWKIITPADGALFASYIVEVGAGGTAGTSDHQGGGNGGTSRFHATGMPGDHPHYLLAEGGHGAAGHVGQSASQGATQTDQANCTGADYCFRGAMGHGSGGGDSDNDRPCGGSVGGASHWGSGEMNGNFSNSQTGTPGRPWGSGGGPGLHNPSGNNGNGASGCEGVCIIEVYG